MQRSSVVLMVALCAGCATLPTPETFGAGIDEGRLDMEQFDFAASGYWKLSDAERTAWLSDFSASQAVSDLNAGCDSLTLRRVSALMWTGLLRQAPDAGAWTASAKALRARLREFDARLQAANPEPASVKTSPVDLLKARAAMFDQNWKQELPPLAAQFRIGVTMARMNRIACDNTEWLRAQLQAIGWFDIPTYGRDADKDAWLLVQHADRSRDFQRAVLARLEELPAGHTDQRNVAYLSDRVAIAEKRLQRFGTQGECRGEGGWQPYEMEDPGRVDERRATIGLTSMSEYIASFPAEVCPKPSK